MLGPVLAGRGLRRLVGGGSCHDEVGVGSAKAKGAHTCKAVGPLPSLQGGVDREGFALQVDQRIQAAEMGMGRQGTMLHAQQHLDQSGDACRRFEMAKIGLEGTHPAGLIGLSAPAEHPAEGIYFNRIAKRGAGAMGLHITHVGSGNP